MQAVDVHTVGRDEEVASRKTSEPPRGHPRPGSWRMRRVPATCTGPDSHWSRDGDRKRAPDVGSERVELRRPFHDRFQDLRRRLSHKVDGRGLYASLHRDAGGVRQRFRVQGSPPVDDGRRPLSRAHFVLREQPYRREHEDGAASRYRCARRQWFRAPQSFAQAGIDLIER